MIEKSKQINRINNFDLIRLLAALEVVYTHSQHHFELNGGFLEKFGRYFLFYFPGVPIFFTVSGFLIFWSFDRNSTELVKYFKNRFLRLFPALWLCLVITFCLLLIDYHNNIFQLLADKSFHVWIIGQLTFFQFWTPDILRYWGVGTPNGSLWTIIVEIQFYVLVPIIYYFTQKFFKMKLIPILIVALISLLFNFYIGQFDEENIQYKLGGVVVFTYLYNFLFGVAAYLYWDKIKKIIEGKFIYWATAYLIYISFFGSYLGMDLNSYFLYSFFHFFTNILLAGLVLSFAFSFNNLSNKLIKHNDISYGVYIYHMLVINFFVQRGLIKDIKYFILTFVFTILLAAFSWFFIEKNFLKLKKK
ncbi:acyltransferase [Flavobacterium sp. ZE23DGlu08]|uniref:acyltransferase family protein n=1 Tax=Flavobacterium sp. ZE23DGlu08 TaxID=3059026 RepID=UPI00266050EC|nr:acyltransferase [Flavobacterium sp. ZE23DGlu08]WKL45049.1 acyltransferase [Flavobacterium sp. ZE23DGlu08]